MLDDNNPVKYVLADLMECQRIAGILASTELEFHTTEKHLPKAIDGFLRLTGMLTGIPGFAFAGEAVGVWIPEANRETPLPDFEWPDGRIAVVEEQPTLGSATFRQFFEARIQLWDMQGRDADQAEMALAMYAARCAVRARDPFAWIPAMAGLIEHGFISSGDCYRKMIGLTVQLLGAHWGADGPSGKLQEFGEKPVTPNLMKLAQGLDASDPSEGFMDGYLDACFNGIVELLDRRARARNAAEWILQSVSLMQFSYCTWMIRRTDKLENPFWRTTSAQMEELRADVGAQYMTILHDFRGSLSPIIDWSYAWGIAPSRIREAMGPELARFILERQLLPDALQPVALEFVRSHGDPAASRRFSRWKRYSFPFLMTLAMLGNVPTKAVGLEPAGLEVSDDEEKRAAVVGKRVQEHEDWVSRVESKIRDPKAAVRETAELLWNHPMSAIGRLMRSVLELGRGRRRAALRPAAQFILLAPRDPMSWQMAAKVAKVNGAGGAAEEFAKMAEMAAGKKAAS